MIENVLQKRHATFRTKIAVKTLISAGIVALAVILPQIAHLAFGAGAGIMLLPMYLPVLLGGCLLGTGWGMGIGMASPLVSFLITSAFSSPMPALARLPFMMAELAVFAAVSGLFANKIEKKPMMAFPAVLLAEVSGRASFLLFVALFGKATPFTPAMILSQIKTGLVGLALQAVIVPIAVIGLRYIIEKDEKND